MKYVSARSVPRTYKEDNWGNQVSSVREFVKKGTVGEEPPFREDLIAAAEQSPLLRLRCQGTAGENTAGWK
jgi:hypothetical protein